MTRRNWRAQKKKLVVGPAGVQVADPNKGIVAVAELELGQDPKMGPIAAGRN